MYTVLQGDTLYGISKQFGVSVDDIKRINNLQSNTITVGQTLNIPNVESSTTYTVKKGDNLYSIAKMFNTTVNDIMNINNLSSTNLQIGQILTIPTQTTDGYMTYTIQRGDSLYSIAQKFNTTVNELKSLNNLTSNLLSIGQQLKIPSTDMNGNNGVNQQYIDYIVKRGDSLYSIAQKFNTTVNELKSLNNLTSNLLSIGQVLKVKTTSNFPTEIKECIGTGYVEPTYQTYTVKKGDSLYSIAQKFDTSVNNLINLNNLNSTSLQIGQVLKIREE